MFIAGMTSRSEKDATPVHPGDMRAQLRQVCENIGRALRAVGGDYSDVVKTTTFTTDVDEYHRVNDERYKYFKTDLPTSALIGVKRLADPALMVKIDGGDSDGTVQTRQLARIIHAQRKIDDTT